MKAVIDPLTCLYAVWLIFKCIDYVYTLEDCFSQQWFIICKSKDLFQLGVPTSLIYSMSVDAEASMD